MKTTIRQAFGYLSVVFILLTAATTALAADKSPVIGKEAHYSVSFSKIQNNKIHKVRLYNAAGTDRVLCSVTGVQGKKYEVFVFNMYSEVVTQMTMRSGETVALQNVAKGNYLFEVLANDEHIERGQLTVK